MRRRLAAALAFACLLAGPQARAADVLVLDDPLNQSSTGNRSGGEFLAGGGWKVTAFTDTIYWHIGGLKHGAFEFSVRGVNPNECRTGMKWKSEFFNMYDPTTGSDGDYGTFRNNPFKNFLRKTNCLDSYTPSRVDSFEIVLTSGSNYSEKDSDVMSWDPGTTYRLRYEWGPDGAGNMVLRVTRDGVDIIRQSDGRRMIVPDTYNPSQLTVRIGWSLRPAADEQAALDMVYSDIKAWDLGAPVAGPDAGTPPGRDAGSPGHAVIDPVDDTYAAPLEPAVAHGGATDVQVGGDGSGGIGRTVYFKFDLSGVQGTINSARLYASATNGGGGGSIYAVGDNSWTEEALTWNNRPATSGAALDTLTSVSVGTEYSWNVTNGLIGGGLRSFAVTSTNSDGAAYASKENVDAAKRPYLVVDYTPGVNPAGPDASAPAGPDAAAPAGADASTTPGADAGPAAGPDATVIAGADAASGAGDVGDARMDASTTQPPDATGACGCATSGTAGGLLFAATATLALARRRRRNEDLGSRRSAG